MILRTLRAGQKLLICGNGAALPSAAFLNELVGRYFKTRGRSRPSR